jgi:hypothetical protein
MPWNYVVATETGQFEAVATHLVSDEIGARERSLGVFKDSETAIKALRDYLKRVSDADDIDGLGSLLPGPDGKIDLNGPTTH